MNRRWPLLALCALLAGCGVGPGEERPGGGAELRVTRDFGQRELGATSVESVREGETAMRLLQGAHDVETRYGGGFVQSIDGLAGEGPDGGRDWFFFVNGLESSTGAAEYSLSSGDVVQWDYRYWEAAMSVPAIVGAYPEPFASGIGGKRLPTRVECEDDASAACEEVKRRLGDQGVTVTAAPLGAPAGEDVLRVVVGRWPGARDVQAAAAVERGPEESGVFARFSEDGGSLSLLDERAEVARTVESGGGLLAATSQPGQRATWLVTGVDDAGVEAAARELDPEALRNAFAVAVTPEGPVDLPLSSEASDEAAELRSAMTAR